MVGASIIFYFFLSWGLILAIVFSGSVFDLLCGQVSSNRCDYSSRTLRNVEGRLTRVVAVMTASCLQIQATSSLSGRHLPLCSNFRKTASCH